MMPAVVLSGKNVDSILGAVAAARRTEELFDIRFREDEELPGFFSRASQKLFPDKYRLIVAGLQVRRRSLSGELIRPTLMDGLRMFARPVTWISAARWDPEDVSAVAHIIGMQNLHVDRSPGSCLELVWRVLAGGDTLDSDLAEIAAAAPGGPERANRWRMALDAFRIGPERLVKLVDLLIQGSPEALDDATAAEAAGILKENAHIASAQSGRLELDVAKLAYVKVPLERFVFRRELGELARKANEADLSLVCFAERGLALLASEPRRFKQVQNLSRYVVDSIQGLDVEEDGACCRCLIFPSQAAFENGFDGLLETLQQGKHVLRG